MKLSFRFLLAGLLGVYGCGGDHEHPDLTTIKFAGMVGSQTFQCGASYAGLGTSSQSYTPADFRFFLHGVQLKTEEGETVDFQIQDDGVFQRDGVALVDFENATGPCSNGTPQTHVEVTGLAPGDHFHELCFTLGIPEAKNHLDAATAQPPFNTESLQWDWTFGYKFLKVDRADAETPSWFVHIGSTACTNDGNPANTTCANPNRSRVCLAEFDPYEDVVAADLAKLFQNSDLSTVSPAPPGCMSMPEDTQDCTGIFKNLGLPFNGAAATAQTFFHAK